MPSFLFLSTMNGGPWGGSEGLWSRTAMRLAGAGHEVACAAFAWPGKERRFAELSEAGCEVRPLPNWRRRKANVLDRLVHEALAKPAQTLAVRALPWRRFDHVAVSQGAWDEITTQPFRDLDRRARSYSIAYHSYREDGMPRRPEDLRRMIRGARANLFASERAREVLAQRLGMELPNVVPFHNALSFDPPSEEPAWPEPASPLRLIAIGTLDCDTKGQDVLLRALATGRWRARAWALDLYGEGPERARVEGLARELGIADRVKLRGHTADVAAALSAAHLLVQPSRVESVGISVHEAMVMARPCLVTRIGDMARWVREGESGFIAERPEEEAVGRALERAWEARGRLRDMGRRARASFLARFPADPVGDFAASLLSAAGART